MAVQVCRVAALVYFSPKILSNGFIGIFRVLRLNNEKEQRVFTIRIGSLTFHELGQLLPHQLQKFHSKDAIYPVSFLGIFLNVTIRAITVDFLDGCNTFVLF